MATGWRRTLGNVRSFVGKSMGGLTGASNVASWIVAGTVAYFLWVKPSQELKREQEERALLATAADMKEHNDKLKHITESQETGLGYGNKRKTNKSEE